MPVFAIDLDRQLQDRHHGARNMVAQLRDVTPSPSKTPSMGPQMKPRPKAAPILPKLLARLSGVEISEA